MAFNQLQKAIGGVTPGGVITIVAGTPVQVTANLKLVAQNGDLMCRQIGFSVDASPSGEVYVNYGNTAGKGNQTALIIQSGTTVALPVNAKTDGQIDANKWFIDGSAACAVAISFADANSW